MGAIRVLKSTHYNFVKLAEKFLLHKIANALNQVRDKASQPCFSDVTKKPEPRVISHANLTFLPIHQHVRARTPRARTRR